MGMSRQSSMRSQSGVDRVDALLRIELVDYLYLRGYLFLKRYLYSVSVQEQWLANDLLAKIVVGTSK
jgi:hypothetical protein